ncbi:MAG: branched-chain amino acid transport system substrate-binding protein [Frankiaceae bacterium]|jgi:branched-chain amino acid transport system substrate-binding protein|nr:branched-chain amino acid transport system substrate-binding protein [Frankiaceae bacterium]
MHTGDPVRRSRRRLALVGVATGMALLSAACGTRMSHDAIVAANPGGVAGAAAGQPGAPGTTTSGGVTPRVGSVVPGGGPSAGPGAVGSVPGAASSRSGTTSGSTGGSSSSGASAEPTGEPLVIGSVGDYSGIAGASEKDGPKALQVWAAYVNDHGGVNGHPVKVYVVDDGMDPQRYQAAVKDLVENKHVIAFVDNFAPFTIQAGVKYLEDKRVPVIGGDCAEYVWNQSPMLFPQCPAYVSSIWGITRVGAVYGKGKNFGAIICSEAAACTNTKQEWFHNGLAKKAGVNPVFEADVSIGQPDFTAECLDARRANVQIMSVVADVGTVGRVVSSCDRQNFHPQYIQGSGTMDAHLATLDGMSDALVQLNDFPWTVSGAGVQEFRDAYRTYAPDDPLTPNASQGWASAIVFQHAAEHVGAHPTSAQILAGLWSMHNETFGGLTPPLTFVRDKAAPDAKCSFAMQVQDGKIEAPFGLKTVCR